MNHIRKRLTYANLMSSIAVFLLLGGGAAFAAGKLAKNSVGSKQIKKNAVTTAKIKNNAVTTAKIKNGAVSGAKINLGTLGTVPNATHASSADTAGSAGSTSRINGINIIRFGERSGGGVAERTVYDNGHLRVTYACEASGAIVVRAYTASDHASIQSYGTSSDTNNSDFNTSENPETISSSDEQRDIIYTDEGGNVVHLSYMAEEERTSGPKCILAGFAEEQ